MELFWYIVLMFMLGMYVILDGYDFGAGIVHLFFAKTEEEKTAVTKSIGPFWDANEVWLIAGGGVLFFAFPTLYASSFSGFYLPLMMVLWLLIFRAVGLELRGQFHNSLWEGFWDKAFGIASLLLALFFGAALGNVVRGVNLGMVENGVSTQESHYFFLALWNPTFDPLAHQQGVIDWFTLLMGILAVVTLTIHGANWVILKTSSSLNERLRIIIFRLNFVLLFLVIISIMSWQYVRPVPFHNFKEHLWLWIFPIIAAVGLLGQFRIRMFKKDSTGFMFSTLFIFGSFATSVASLFPNLLPSTNEVNPSLTIYNTAANDYGLSVGLNWFIIAAILVVAYFVIQFRVFKGKLDNIDYGGH
ncbi:cytochrome d ubiquinol oxidase subunit II [Capnocytophaga felis]|uniref:Cytochrome D oxidase subunit I n=1 Tax=Capnocytophaga felis TaxID=2267611 RepID=A0A5M4B9C7_9FLAO|nr:cytochrome d ubiquinol oxidase subunit II [Capnocytophaga felis]GET46224.1 cytochrome D oxidase subunit I [Capnocytophaga felis]GET48237.1 cytochrome D oxidase subunit I [Capnocytophaga felis]